MNPLYAFIGGACLSCSLCIRPNFAIAVVALGLFFMASSWRARNFKAMASAAAGLSVALLMPLHNWMFGDEFVLIAASNMLSVPLTPMTYARGFYGFMTGHWRDPDLLRAFKQVVEYLLKFPMFQYLPKGFTVVFILLRIPTLIATICVALKPERHPYSLVVLAWTAIAAHIPMLFIFTRFRYAMLGWDLSAVVTIALVVQYIRRKEREGEI
jgi:hypothetical protein